MVNRGLHPAHLIHGFHWNGRFGPTRGVGVNLIEGTDRQVLDFLDRLDVRRARHARHRRDAGAVAGDGQLHGRPLARRVAAPGLKKKGIQTMAIEPDCDGAPSFTPMPQEILDYYDRATDEAERLTAGRGKLERIRLHEILERFLSGFLPPAVICDVGGAAGVHSFWLAELGYA